MVIAVSTAIQRLDARGLVRRCKGGDDADLVIDYVREQLRLPALPKALADLYRERVGCIDQFSAVRPIWNDWVGWRPIVPDVTDFLAAQAVPLFYDGCGSIFAFDLSAGGDDSAVYFFDKADGWEKPGYAAGSSLGAFLILLGDHDAALQEKRPSGWELTIDPDIDKCPRAPPIWLAG